MNERNMVAGAAGEEPMDNQPNEKANMAGSSHLSITILRRLILTRLLTDGFGPQWKEIRDRLPNELEIMDSENYTNRCGLFKALKQMGRHHVGDICEQLHIEERTMYNWRNDIIWTGIVLAAERGLFSLTDKKIR